MTLKPSDGIDVQCDDCGKRLPCNARSQHAARLAWMAKGWRKVNYKRHRCAACRISRGIRCQWNERRYDLVGHSCRKDAEMTDTDPMTGRVLFLCIPHGEKKRRSDTDFMCG